MTTIDNPAVTTDAIDLISAGSFTGPEADDIVGHPGKSRPAIRVARSMAIHVRAALIAAPICAVGVAGVLALAAVDGANPPPSDPAAVPQLGVCPADRLNV